MGARGLRLDCRIIEAISDARATLTSEHDLELVQRQVEGLSDSLEGGVHPTIRRVVAQLARSLEEAWALAGEASDGRRLIDAALLELQDYCPDLMADKREPTP
jgi:hypothetical protein